MWFLGVQHIFGQYKHRTVIGQNVNRPKTFKAYNTRITLKKKINKSIIGQKNTLIVMKDPVCNI